MTYFTAAILTNGSHFKDCTSQNLNVPVDRASIDNPYKFSGCCDTMGLKQGEESHLIDYNRWLKLLTFDELYSGVARILPSSV